MSQGPRFSVIIPTYNRAHLISRCIQSVANQTYPDWEVIVADDGSSDNTKDVVAQWAKEDDRIRYAKQENAGAGSARNLGAAEALGAFFVFLDSDDTVSPNWLRSFHEEIEKTGAEVVCCGCELLRDNGSVIRVRVPNSPDRPLAFQRGYFFTGTFAIRRDVFEEVGGYSEVVPANQHSELRMRLLPRMDSMGWTLSCIDDALVQRYSHDGPSIRSNANAVFQSGEYILERYAEILKQSPGSYASWASTVGASGAAIGNWRRARFWFAEALKTDWFKSKYWARWIVTWIPLVRDKVWRLHRLGVPRADGE